MTTAENECPFVSRGGLKLRHALNVFGIDPRGLLCADLGCSTGGFTDCLLQAAAARVYAVDTAYGQLAWKLRSDPRVTVLERSNALHVEPPDDARAACGLVVIDMGWTRQALAVPAALRWLGPDGRIISLIKPHYEAPRAPGDRLGKGAALSQEQSEAVLHDVLNALPACGVRVLGSTRSPVLGGKAAKGSAKGNTEYLALLAPDPAPSAGV